jgi:hypothetical protein
MEAAVSFDVALKQIRFGVRWGILSADELASTDAANLGKRVAEEEARQKAARRLREEQAAEVLRVLRRAGKPISNPDLAARSGGAAARSGKAEPPALHDFRGLAGMSLLPDARPALEPAFSLLAYTIQHDRLMQQVVFPADMWISKKVAEDWTSSLRRMLRELRADEVDAIQGYPVTFSPLAGRYVRIDGCLASWLSMSQRILPQLELAAIDKLLRRLHYGQAIDLDLLDQCENDERRLVDELIWLPEKYVAHHSTNEQIECAFEALGLKGDS